MTQWRIDDVNTTRYECDRCHRPIGVTGKVRRSRADGLVLTALCASCLAAGASLRLASRVAIEKERE